MAFHDTQFPADISRGATSRTRRLSDIISLRSGAEFVNTVWKNSRHEYDVGIGIRNLDDIYDIMKFYEARMGRANSFRFKDWLDYKSGSPNRASNEDQQNMAFIGIKEGTTTVGLWQLQKEYKSGDNLPSYIRKITKPVVGSVQTVPSVNENKIDHITGIIEISGKTDPQNPPTASFEFDVPVRFSEDTIDANVELFNAGQVPNVNLVEVMV